MRKFFVLLLTIPLFTACQPASLPITSAAPGEVVSPIPLTFTPAPKPLLKIKSTFTDGDRTIYLDNGVVRVGIDKYWGGAIREIWYEEENMVNNFDGGRLIAVSFYDSNMTPASSHPNDTGWNPTPSDMYNHTNQLLEYSVSDNTLYIKTRYIQWYPNDKGGGQGQSIPTDVFVETWIEFLHAPEIIHLKYRVTNEGNDSHGVAGQEFPFAYIRAPFNRFVSYTGNNRWTNGDVQINEIALDQSTNGSVVATENWGGFVNAEDVGLVLWAPETYQRFTYSYFNNSGPTENRTHYILPNTFLELRSGYSQETEAFLLAGKWQNAREQIYFLQDTLTFTDILPCFGTVDTPSPNASVSGTIDIAGWAIDNSQVAKVRVLVDGVAIGEANYGHARPDVAQGYPDISGAPNFGFIFQLDTTDFSNGLHVIEVMAEDTSGNASVLLPGKITINISN